MRILISVLLLAALAAPASALSTAQRSADGGVTIRSNVSNGAVLDPGDQVAFQYQSARDAAVIVFDIDTQGYVTLLTDSPVEVSARDSQKLPNDHSELTAGGEPGVEFVFALAVADRNAIDEGAFASMRDETRRINGDPFIAANMIAGELVRDISQHAVFIGYTYFYVSDRVEYPCYLCGTCDGSGGSTECDGYRIVQNFDRNVALAYPLARGYEMVETASTQTETVGDSAADNVAIPDEPTDVNFYPYGSEVHYADPVAMNLWYTWGWYDPFFYYYPYCYPYYSPWHVSIGFGWGWGWGGYYCGGWYDPWYGCGYYPGYPYDPYYPGYPDTRPVRKFKSQYKSASGASTLSENRQYAMKRDTDLRVASKSVKPGTTKFASWNNPGRSTRTGFTKDPFSGSSHRVKTSVSGGRSITREAWTKGRSGSHRDVPVYRSKVFQPKSTAGKSVINRSNGTRVKGGSYAPAPRGNTTRSKSTYSAPPQRSAPRPSGSAPRMGTYKGSTGSSSFRSGGGWNGGSRSGGFTGGGTRGGTMKGGRGR